MCIRTPPTHQSKQRFRPYLSQGPDPVSEAIMAENSMIPVATSCSTVDSSILFSTLPGASSTMAAFRTAVLYPYLPIMSQARTVKEGSDRMPTVSVQERGQCNRASSDPRGSGCGALTSSIIVAFRHCYHTLVAPTHRNTACCTTQNALSHVVTACTAACACTVSILEKDARG